MNKIRVADLATICMSENDGIILRKKIIRVLEQHDNVVVDFEKIKFFASPFMNASIGYLVSENSIAYFKERINILNLSNIGKNVLELVIKNAVEFSKMDKYEQDRISEILQNLED